MRLAGNNLLAPDTLNRTEVLASASDVQSNSSRRMAPANFSASLTHNF